MNKKGTALSQRQSLFYYQIALFSHANFRFELSVNATLKDIFVGWIHYTITHAFF